MPPNLKVSWLWLVDPPQNQQACTFLRFVQYGESVQSLAFQKISELLDLGLARANFFLSLSFSRSQVVSFFK